MPDSEKSKEGQEVKKYICEICGKEFATSQALSSHRRWEHGEEKPETQKPEEKPSTLPPPPEVQTIEDAISFISERLGHVYGVEKYDKMIVEALRDDPTPLRDANLLHAFIKSLAPRAYDSHLSTVVIKPLYAKFPNLPQAVDKYLSSITSVPHLYPPTHQIYTYPLYYPTYTSYYPYQPPPYYTHLPPPHTPYYPPRPHKTYKVVVDGQEIETDEAGLMAWKRYLQEREEYERRRQQWELEMKKLEAEIKKATEEVTSRTQLVPVKVGDKEIQVPAYLAPLYMRLDEESRKEIEKLREELHRKEVESLKHEIDELKRRPSFVEELRYIQEVAPMLGFQRSGRTTADLLDSLIERIDQRAAQLISKIPTQGEWKPEVTRTPQERAKKAEEIKKVLEKSEEILKAEDELIRAAANVK